MGDTSLTLDGVTIAAIHNLLDKQAIVECTLRYSRGVDRLDVDLIRSVFHHDARIRQRSPSDFIAYIEAQRDVREACQHYVTNQTIELNGNIAHVETYYIDIMKMKRGADPTLAGDVWTDAMGDLEVQDEVVLLGGRYVDEFEKRNGEWRVAVRVGTSDWLVIGDGSRMKEYLDKRGGATARDKSDVSYSRPLLPIHHVASTDSEMNSPVLGQQP